MLELAVQANVDIDTATSIALGSMMSTAGANLSVGPPYDGCIYLKDSLKPVEFRIQSDSPLLAELRESWERQMRNALIDIQRISWADETISVLKNSPEDAP